MENSIVTSAAGQVFKIEMQCQLLSAMKKLIIYKWVLPAGSWQNVIFIWPVIIHLFIFEKFNFDEGFWNSCLINLQWLFVKVMLERSEVIRKTVEEMLAAVGNGSPGFVCVMIF